MHGGKERSKIEHLIPACSSANVAVYKGLTLEMLLKKVTVTCEHSERM